MIETKPCPECDRFIPVSAVKCRCGWTAPQGRNDYIACAVAGCPTSATIHARTKTGWANVCPDHDKALVQKSAEAYCAALGLDTTEKRRAWLRGKRLTPKRFDEAVMREPGQDDEEAAIAI